MLPWACGHPYTGLHRSDPRGAGCRARGPGLGLCWARRGVPENGDLHVHLAGLQVVSARQGHEAGSLLPGPGPSWQSRFHKRLASR